MKSIIATIVFVFSVGIVQAQQEEKIKSKRLTKVEAADMTKEQRLVHETERKAKNKKPVSMQKKVKMAKKQDKQSRNTKVSKPKKRKND